VLYAVGQGVAVDEWEPVSGPAGELEDLDPTLGEEEHDAGECRHQQDAQAGGQRVERVVGVKEHRNDKGNPEDDVQHHC
jgi:hypothetical protein